MHKQKIDITEDFIGTFDGFIPDSACDRAINHFKEQENFEKTISRLESEGTPSSFKKDSVTYIGSNNIDSIKINDSFLPEVIINFRNVLNIYLKETSILSFLSVKELHYKQIKIQKTKPAEGYHVWHVEQDFNENNLNRVLVYTIYLNDIDKGGETEFLLQKKRVEAKKGRICIFPAQFPYVHRGNPPLETDKYIITSWLTSSR